MKLTSSTTSHKQKQIRKFILQAAEREGIDLVLEIASVNPPKD